MKKISGRIRHLIVLLETQLIQLWLTLEQEQDEQEFFNARRHLHHAQYWINQVNQKQPLKSEHLYPQNVFSLLFQANRTDAPEDLRDMIIEELGLILHHLNAPAVVQGPVNSFHNGLTDSEILYLLQTWNDTQGHRRSRWNGDHPVA